MIVIDEKSNLKKLKLIDFGLSCYYDDLTTDKTEIIRCGTLSYSAPEVIDTDCIYD